MSKPIEPPFRQALRQLAAWRLRQSGPHPSPEELVGYAKRSISGAMSDRIQDHIAICPGCAKTALALIEARRGDARPDLSVEWQRFKERLAEEVGNGD